MTGEGVDLLGLVERFSRSRVAVAGDAILDVYLRGVPRGLCREAPAPVVAVRSVDVAPGGAGNVAANVAALGATPVLVSPVRRDEAGAQLREVLGRFGVGTGELVESDLPTVVKRRVKAGGQLLLRLDEGTEPGIAHQDADTSMLERILHVVGDADALVISDYGYGALNAWTVDGILAAHARASIVVLDARHLEQYVGLRAAVASPNYGEAVRLLGLPILDDECDRLDQIRRSGPELLVATGANSVVVTLGSAGAMLFEPGRPVYHTGVRDRIAGEVVGAGDVVAAGLALALVAGADPPAAVDLAIQAAGVAVEASTGTARCDRSRLAARLRADEKVLDSTNLAAWASTVRRAGRRIVFTNGCFDLLHEGHVAFLSQARALGDVLVVAVNDDASVRSLKGSERPVVELAGRMRMLMALSCVDHVVAFGGPTPVALIEAVHPAVYAKGGDYRGAELPEAAALAGLGVEVRVLDYLVDRSTSRIIERVRAMEATA